MASGIELESANIFLTSMAPEAIELTLYLSTYYDLALCEELRRRSFLGLISPQDREDIGLPLLPTVGELIYPQLALPALTLGLQAKFFQGGEEISGYLSIIRALVQGFNCANDLQLAAPDWCRPDTSFLHGTDGNHMMSENAILLSEPSKDLHARYESTEDHVIHHMAAALGSTDTRSDTPHAHFRKLLDRETERYRSNETTPEQVMDCLTDGAARAKYLLRDTLGRVKKSMGIPHIIEY